MHEGLIAVLKLWCVVAAADLLYLLSWSVWFHVVVPRWKASDD